MSKATVLSTHKYSTAYKSGTSKYADVPLVYGVTSDDNSVLSLYGPNCPPPCTASVLPTVHKSSS